MDGHTQIEHQAFLRVQHVVPCKNMLSVYHYFPVTILDVTIKKLKQTSAAKSMLRKSLVRLWAVFMRFDGVVHYYFFGHHLQGILFAFSFGSGCDRFNSAWMNLCMWLRLVKTLRANWYHKKMSNFKSFGMLLWILGEVTKWSQRANWILETHMGIVGPFSVQIGESTLEQKHFSFKTS